MEPLPAVHDSARVRAALQEIDAAQLSRQLDLEVDDGEVRSASSRLRVAAFLSLAEAIGDRTLDGLLRQLAAEPEPDPSLESDPQGAFAKWSGYLGSLNETGARPSIDDLLFFSAAGLLARQPVALRHFLREPSARQVVDEALDSLPGETEWDDRVTKGVSLALLLLIRQENHKDVASAGNVIATLVADQKEVERSWLDSRTDSRMDAVALLGLYHLAQAVVRTSEFVLAGSVETDGQMTTDIGVELRRLLVRAEEYMALSRDLEKRFWLNSLAVILWCLRSDSIWVSGQGISDRLDALLKELSRVGRERPVFSLLPSQQDAIRKSLLDPSRIAIVLQMPTSAGKTLLAEFSIVQAFEAYKDSTRAVYIVPTRALATQVRRVLSEDLRPLGIQVAAAGSAFEEDPFELEMLLSTDGVVVATPEKLDLLLRAHPSWFETLRLVVVDEAHLLHDSERGVRLELLLANLRRERPQARLLLLTPFLQNAKQIATWLGGARGLSIEVQWRPSRLLLGIAGFSGYGKKKQLEMELQEPYGGKNLKSITVPAPSAAISTGAKRIIYFVERFQRLGCILALFSASPIEAEKTAAAVARKRDPLPGEKRTPGLRVAIALARSEYGPDSALADCLERGVAFHHSSLSPVLRFLVEDQVRVGTIDFIAATTTLAQGMNFPVAVVLVHSVHKPYGGGSLSPAEFWNIAGRAGRVGLVDKGLVIFTDPDHRSHFERYSTHLSESVRSALLDVLQVLAPNKTLKEHYRQHEALRPFIQYLAHAAARESPAKALADLEELLQASLANVQVANDREAQAMRRVARGYLEGIGGRQVGYLRAADTTGLSSFSFDELFAKIGNDPLLMGGPGQVLARGKEGIAHLVEVLKWLPELELAIGFGPGSMSVDAVAEVVNGWVGGASVPQLAKGFPQENADDKIRQAARYLYGTVSQTMAWGAHAYIRGWALRKPPDTPDLSPKEAMLGAYIQYGVHTPEAAVASLLGVPRQFAEPLASHYRERFGELSPEKAAGFKSFIEEADRNTWRVVLEGSDLAGAVDPGDVRAVWRQMWGLL